MGLITPNVFFYNECDVFNEVEVTTTNSINDEEFILKEQHHSLGAEQHHLGAETHGAEKDLCLNAMQFSSEELEQDIAERLRYEPVDSEIEKLFMNVISTSNDASLPDLGDDLDFDLDSQFCVATCLDDPINDCSTNVFSDSDLEEVSHDPASADTGLYQHQPDMFHTKEDGAGEFDFCRISPTAVPPSCEQLSQELFLTLIQFTPSTCRRTPTVARQQFVIGDDLKTILKNKIRKNLESRPSANFDYRTFTARTSCMKTESSKKVKQNASDSILMKTRSTENTDSRRRRRRVQNRQSAARMRRRQQKIIDDLELESSKWQVCNEVLATDIQKLRSELTILQDTYKRQSFTGIS